MKKMIFVILTMTSLSASSQDYYHAIGVGALSGYYIEPNSFTGAFTYGINYKASLGWEVGRDNAFAISAYPFLGITGAFSSRDGARGSLGFELPVNGEYYFGEIDDKNFFLGAGINIMSVRDSEGFGGRIFGPNIGIGGNFEMFGQPIGIRLGYTLGVNKPKGWPSGTKYASHGVSLTIMRSF